MPELLLTDKCNQTQHRLKIKVNFSEHSSSLRPLWRSGSDLNRNLWLYGCGEKEGPLIVVWVPYTGSHRVVWFFPVLLQCIVYRVYMGCLIEEGGSLPFQILRYLSHHGSEIYIDRAKSKIQRSLVWTSRYLEQDFGCRPRSRLNGRMILYFWRETRDL